MGCTVGGYAGHALGLWNRAIGTGGGIEALAAVVTIPTRPACGLQACGDFADAYTHGSHSLQGTGEARRVPKLKRSHLPVEPGAHGTVDVSCVIGDLRKTVRRVVP